MGNPLQYSYPKTPVDRGAWRATDHGVESQTGLERLTVEHIGIQERYGCLVSVFRAAQPAVISQSRTFQNRSPRGHPRSPLAHAQPVCSSVPLTGKLGVPFRKPGLCC